LRADQVASDYFALVMVESLATKASHQGLGESRVGNLVYYTSVLETLAGACANVVMMRVYARLWSSLWRDSEKEIDNRLERCRKRVVGHIT